MTIPHDRRAVGHDSRLMPFVRALCDLILTTNAPNVLDVPIRARAANPHDEMFVRTNVTSHDPCDRQHIQRTRPLPIQRGADLVCPVSRFLVNRSCPIKHRPFLSSLSHCAGPVNQAVRVAASANSIYEPCVFCVITRRIRIYYITLSTLSTLTDSSCI